MPLERLEVSTFSAFERALDLPEEDSDDEHEFTIKRVRQIPVESDGIHGTILVPRLTEFFAQYVLGDLLELLRLYAPKMRHLKLEDYGDITRFSLSQELSPWPIVRGITELELVATPANALQLLLTEVSTAFHTFPTGENSMPTFCHSLALHIVHRASPPHLLLPPSLAHSPLSHRLSRALHSQSAHKFRRDVFRLATSTTFRFLDVDHSRVSVDSENRVALEGTEQRASACVHEKGGRIYPESVYRVLSCHTTSPGIGHAERLQD